MTTQRRRLSSYTGIGGARHRKTVHLSRAIAAPDARADLRDALSKGELPRAGVEMPLGDALDKFVQAARDGVALKKWRRRHRPRLVEDLESVRPHLPDSLARRQPDNVKCGDLQALVDKLSAKGLSGSRVRSVINGLRSFYTWEQDHELASQDSAQRVKQEGRKMKIAS